VTTTAETESRKGPRGWLSREQRRARKAARKAELEAALPAVDTEIPAVDIPPNDPVLAYFQANPEPVDVDGLKIDTPGVRALRDAGVKMVVPLVTQGELIGLLNLGERLSEQEYSADDRKLLENLAGQAAPALRVAQLVREQEAEVRRRERYEQEMRVAQLIQQNFLPKELPDQQGWKLNAFYRPAREVGGDFYDFIDLPDGRLGVVVGDVTDKGVPAALVMASTRSVLRSVAQRFSDPGTVLEQVNEQICPDMPPKMFVTCLYGILDPADGRFVFANAGHNLPCVQTSDGAEEVRATGMPLGLLSGMTYEENEVTVAPGHSIVLYSDALPEAHDPDGEMFSFPRLVETVGSTPGGVELIDRLLTSLHEFTGADWEQEDDITLVTVQRGTHTAAGLLTDPDSAVGAQDPDAGISPDGEVAIDLASIEDLLASTATALPEPSELVDDPGQLLTEFSVPSAPGNERQVMDRVLEAVDDLSLTEERRNRLATAVAEATMNAIEHGNLNRSELYVEVRVFVSEHALFVRITDLGGGAPAPEDVEAPDIEAKLRGDQSPRGWGLFLIRNMVDDMHVATDDEHHTVELVMRFNGDGDV
jgi:serine phosphatase RsbU (regulator of sigma subunit)/anti-sigma regulatory factor (Ser/Thr protein kinase)